MGQHSRELIFKAIDSYDLYTNSMKLVLKALIELSINDVFKLIDTLPYYELDYQTETEKTIQLYEIIKNISGLWTEQTSDVFQISNKDTISLTSQIINRLNSKKIILNRVSSSALSFEKKIDSLLSKDKIKDKVEDKIDEKKDEIHDKIDEKKQDLIDKWNTYLKTD
jgi:hypothetical protein